MTVTHALLQMQECRQEDIPSKEDDADDNEDTKSVDTQTEDNLLVKQGKDDLEEQDEDVDKVDIIEDGNWDDDHGIPV